MSETTLTKIITNSSDTITTAATIANLLPAKSQSRKYITTALGIATAAVAINDTINTWDQRTHYTISVATGTWYYELIAGWIQKRRWGGDPTNVTIDEENGTTTAGASITETLNFKINNARVHATVISGDNDKKSKRRNVWLDEDIRAKLLITTTSEHAYKHMVEAFTNLTRPAKKEGRLYTHTDYDEWVTMRKLPDRHLDSVILTEGQNERIVNDLERFLKAKDAYTQMGMPWHRGYLFYGEAGTGKTSYATALAAHFHRDVYFLSIANLHKDTSLFRIVNILPANALLIVEDMSAGTGENETKTEGVTVAGLLNTLDGLATPEGLITIITTNHRDKFDPTLLRPGRVDLQEHFSYANADQITRMVKRFAPQGINELHLPETLPQITPAALMENLKKHYDNPTQAVKEITKQLNQTKEKHDI